jgi:hypothetical protein
MNDPASALWALPEVVPETGPVVLLLRHAERPPMPPGEHGHSLRLTPQGARSAEILGQWLGSRVAAISTSPVPRCVETAEAIRLGALSSAAIVRDTWLGDPGPFVRDRTLAWSTFRELGIEGVIEALVLGKKGLPGMNDPDVAARDLSRHLSHHLRSDRAEEARFHLAITHDIVLAAFVARLSRRRLERSSWPRFLEAAAFWREGDQHFLSYRERHERVL